MSEYTLSAKITADASGFQTGIQQASSAMEEFQEKCRKTSSSASSDMGSSGSKIAGAWNTLKSKTSSVWGSIRSSVSTGISGAWGAVRNNAAQMASALGGVAAAGAAAVAGIALQGGFDRALAIDNAKKKLAGFGHDAKGIASIMASAQTAVKGTAYGLGDAATAATMLSAAGVKSGQDMTNSLQAAANVAAASGRDFASVGTIFGSVAARGKLMGDDMLQLTSSGVPVLQLLASHLGKTSQEVSQMVSDGKIDFQTFSDAMRVGLGDSAKSSGDTFAGAAANVRAALSRMTEPLMTGIIQGAVGLFKQLAPAIDGVASALGPVVPVLAPVIAGFAAFSASGLAPLIANIPVLGGMLGPVSGLLSALGGPVGIALAAFAGLVAVCPPLQQALGNVGGAISGFASAIGTALAPVISAVLPVIQSLFQTVGQQLADAFNTAAGFITQLTNNFTSFIDTSGGMLGILQPVADFFISALQPVVTAAGAAFNQVATAVTSFLLPAMQQLQPIIDILVAVLQGAIMPTLQMIANFLGAVLTPAVTAAGEIVSAAMQIISGAITTAVGVIEGVVGVFVGVFTGDWSMAASGAAGIMNGLSGVLTGIMNGLSGALRGILNGISGAFQSILSGIKEIVSGIFDSVANSIKSKIDTAKNTVSDGLHAISNFFSGLHLEFPKIKLPHFSITGSFSLVPPSTPHLSVSWYAKGGIFTRPTIFAGSGVGVGEAGPEVVSPVNKLTGFITDAMSGLISGGQEIDYERMGEAIVNAFARAGLHSEIDGRELAKWVRAYV